jgi:hypothetical protein
MSILQKASDRVVERNPFDGSIFWWQVAFGEAGESDVSLGWAISDPVHDHLYFLNNQSGLHFLNTLSD